ncbi:MAG: tol-pal system-associated acyl-CoA thioesterase [Pseudomonadota bacterium]
MMATSGNLSGSAGFSWPVRVYYEDTDSGGVVYYANYLKFMERARTEWLRAHGFEQTRLADEHRVIFVVREVQIKYLKPALFNDLLKATVTVTRLGRGSIDFDQTVERDCVLAQAHVKLACVDRQSFKPVAVPQAIKAKLGNIA